MSAPSVSRFEMVPNISEGRDAALIDRCAASIAAYAHLAHRTSDAVHHRSVFTAFGDAEQILAASKALALVVRDAIDLRVHRGAHPRIGALDVLPIIPLGMTPMTEAVALAHRIGAMLWNDVGIPVFFYGEAALRPERRLLADVRRGEYEGLAQRAASDAYPDHGDIWRHEQAGAVAVGARPPLVAFNLELATDDLVLGRRIARTIRERDGGLRTLRAIAVRLDEGRVQISCNVTDSESVPLPRLLALVRRLAASAGVVVLRCELIGLVPRLAVQTTAETLLGLSPLPGRLPSYR